MLRMTNTSHKNDARARSAFLASCKAIRNRLTPSAILKNEAHERSSLNARGIQWERHETHESSSRRSFTRARKSKAALSRWRRTEPTEQLERPAELTQFPFLARAPSLNVSIVFNDGPKLSFERSLSSSNKGIRRGDPDEEKRRFSPSKTSPDRLLLE